jgi:hypothetical protein
VKILARAALLDEIAFRHQRLERVEDLSIPMRQGRADFRSGYAGRIISAKAPDRFENRLHQLRSHAILRIAILAAGFPGPSSFRHRIGSLQLRPILVTAFSRTED